MAYTLGVDLGTTFSAAATIDEDGVPTMVGLGNRALQIPSVVYVRDDGTLLVGEQAEREASTDPTRVVREFKRRIGDDVPIVVAGQPYSAELMMAQVLRWVVEQTTERHGEPPAQVTLTHPAAWTRDYKVGKLHEAARLAGLNTISTCPEPVAAALNYSGHHRVEVGERICVYDLGGGTFDVCVLAKTETGFEILGNPSGDAFLGGIDFDKAITGKVGRDLSALFATADLDDPGFFRFQRDCVEAKESLSVDVATVIPVSIAGITTSVRLTRAEFEAMIDPLLTETISKTAFELSSAGVAAADLRSIVLIGGSSRIPLVTEKLTSAFRCPVARNTHPKHDVALGAALAGWLETTPRATAVVGGPPSAADQTPARPAHRRRLVRGSVAGVGVAVVIAGAVIVGGRFSAGTAEAQNPGLSTAVGTAQSESPIAGAESTTPTGATQSAASSTGLAATGSPSPTRAVDGQTTAPTRTPAPISPPPSFDRNTVTWFRELCGGGGRMNELEIPATMAFSSVEAAQTKYVQSYQQRAAISDATATTLELIALSPSSRDRFDPPRVIKGLRDVAGVMRQSAQEVRELSPLTPKAIADLVRMAEGQISATLQRVDPATLSVPEKAFIGSLPGCELMGQ